MQDANFIIGFVAAGTATVRDDFGSSQTGHAADADNGGTDDLTAVSGTEANGRTEISFTIPLNSGDTRDRVLSAGQSYTVILAYGSDGADNLTSYHAVRTATTITL